LTDAPINLLVAITARASYSRIKSVLAAAQARPDIQVRVLASGSALLDRYGRVVDLIRSDGFDVVEEIYTFVEGNGLINMATTAANTITHSAQILSRLKPDYVITVADRYETLGTAVAAAYCGIPLIHVQGGEVTGNIDEKVRHAKTKLADIHLVSNDDAGRRVIQMGEHPDTVHVTGCPSLDVVEDALRIGTSEVQALVDHLGVGAHIDLNKAYIVVLQHPETDYHDQSFEQMSTTLHVLEELGLPALVFWPNVDAGSDSTSKAIRVFRENDKLQHVRFLKNLDGNVFLRLLKGAQCLIGNSSVGVRESSLIGVPVVNIGHRQAGRQRGRNLVDVSWDHDAILAAVRDQMAHGAHEPDAIYGDGQAGKRIADLIAQRPAVAHKRFFDIRQADMPDQYA
jgi:UDP-hydrolysing UDP-N-acetyl-D-glucosamine 2-epimerase